MDTRFYTRDTSNCPVGLSKRYLEREISASVSTLHLVFFIFLFLYCKHWCLVLVWLFVASFSALVGESLIPLLIIVDLFFWSG